MHSYYDVMLLENFTKNTLVTSNLMFNIIYFD